MKRMAIAIFSAALLTSATGNALAAPSYVDVPAKHPAYEAVSRTTKDGLLYGYKDGTFRGDKPVTRYEMAQILDRVMEKAGKDKAEVRQQIEKEVELLTDRTYRLEQKFSSIKFWGDARIRYQHNWNLRQTGDCWMNDRFQERLRLNMKAELSKKTEFVGRISAENTAIEKINYELDKDMARNNAITWDIGKFVHKNVAPHVNVEIGRSDVFLGQGLLADTNGGYDSIRLTYKKDKVKAFYAFGNISPATGLPFHWDNDPSHSYGANVSVANLAYAISDTSELTGSLLYSHSERYPYKIAALGYKGKLKEFTFTAEAAHNFSGRRYGDGTRYFGCDDTRYDVWNKSAWMVSLWYKGADKAVEKSWGAYIDYRDVGSRAIDGRLTTLNSLYTLRENAQDLGYWHTGVQGFGVGFNYTPAKNVVFTGTVEILKSQETPHINYGKMVYLRAEYFF